MLKDVASLIKEGQYANMWELKENWKDIPPAASDSKAKLEKLEDNEEDEEDDEDEDDFEIVDA